MYDTMKREYEWSHMARDVYKTERDCPQGVWKNTSEKCTMRQDVDRRIKMVQRHCRGYLNRQIFNTSKNIEV